MKSILSFFLPIALLLFGCETRKSPKTFSLINESQMLLKKDGPEEFLRWEFNEAAEIWKYNLEHVPAVEQFRDSLKFKLGSQKFKALVDSQAMQTLPDNVIEGVENGDKINDLLVHTGKVGKVRPINLLEAQLLNYQISKYPFLSHPTEFHAFITVNDSLNRYRIYYGASDKPWPPRPSILIKNIEEDRNKGWRLKYHLHNHYEPSSNNYLGILAPSLADAQYFKMLRDDFNIEVALITNGIHTVELRPHELDLFESH